MKTWNKQEKTNRDLALVRFPDGSILYTIYIGTKDRVHHALQNSPEEVISNPFPDPEWDIWLAAATEKDSPEDFYAAQEKAVYNKVEKVKIYTSYRNGVTWTATASKIDKRIVSDFSSGRASN